MMTIKREKVVKYEAHAARVSERENGHASRVPHKQTAAIALAALILISPAHAGEGVQNLLFLSPSAPIFIRVHLADEGNANEGNLSAWDKYIDLVFKSRDKNQDGILSGKETNQIPDRTELLGLGFQFRQTERPTGSVDRARLEQYLRRAVGGPFTIRMAGASPVATDVRSMSQPTGEGLFDHLDTNQDGKLSAEEFQFSSRLRKLDLDDDESINRAELQPTTGYTPYRQRESQADQNNSPFINLADSRSPIRLARQLNQRYDKNQDRKLSKDELLMTTKAFANIDADGDEQIDFDELLQLVRDPSPQVEVIARLGQSKPLIEFVKTDLGGQVDRREGQSLLITLLEMKMEIAAQRGRVYSSQTLAASYRRYFQNADTDKNGYLEKKETRSSVAVANAFDRIDRDGDGKIYEKELLANAGRVMVAQRSQTVMSVSDEGSRLFDIVDANRDSRVSARELKLATEKVAGWDKDQDGQVAKSEIAQNWRLIFSQGPPLSTTRRAMASRQPFQRPTSGPRWFQKMDRNGDGEVSEREFLGPLADFAKIDRDNSNSIDASEASSSH